jgi:hypothetical protein
MIRRPATPENGGEGSEGLRDWQLLNQGGAMVDSIARPTV